MSLNQSKKNQEKEALEAINKEVCSSFEFSPKDTNRSEPVFSISDSAYNSMVCSPFSPVVLSKSFKAISPTYQEIDSIVRDSMSPFLESSENDEVFKVSLEHICNDGNYPRPNFSTQNCVTDNSTFRPISAYNETTSQIQLRQNLRRSSLTSQRTISTQTRFSMSSMMYRPNSAPLQEGLEEELDDINIDEMDNTNYGIHRNYTCHCIRSPMPDLIQPTFRQNNQLLANRLSLIADQFDERINNLTSTVHTVPRTRRFSTSSIGQLDPESSFLDLLCSFINTIDNTLPRRRRRRHAINSFS